MKQTNKIRKLQRILNRIKKYKSKIAAMTDEQLAVAGIPAGLVRLSCGLEDKEDLLADLQQALAGITE